MKKTKSKRIICMVLVLINILCNFTFVNALENSYSDITDYYPYSSWAVETGEKYNLIFLEDNTRECKRYEIANLLYYVSQVHVDSDKPKFNDISDVDDKIVEKINKIAQANIINGYADGSFKPNNKVTRAEFATMLERTKLLSNSIENKPSSYLDTQNHWAKKSIEFISNTGILAGKGNNMFYPDSGITPQEILIILDRMVKKECISSNTLVEAITNTFKSKLYDKNEQYIIEIIYNNFDEVQNFMTYNFPYKKYYDYKNWNQFATYSDIQNVTYFMMSYNSELLDSGATREMFDNIGRTITSIKRNSNKYFTMREFLYSISELEKTTNVGMFGYGATYFTQNPDIKYSNKTEFSDDDYKMFRTIVGNTYNTLLVNNSMYLPLDAPVTKYMLNYFVMQMQKTYNSYKNSLNYGFVEYQGKYIEYETDPSKIPYNYADYPYIVKGVPKYIYEKPYLYNGFYIPNKPVECFGQYSEVTGDLGEQISEYYNLILNVDYRTIDLADFTNKAKNIYYFIPESDIEEYVQYVKNNKIVLKGKGAAVPGTLYVVDGTIHIKSMLEFEVVSATNMKNLLLGDMSEILYKDVIYSKNKYKLYPDIEIHTGPAMYNGEITFFYRKVKYWPILLGIYWNNDIYTIS